MSGTSGGASATRLLQVLTFWDLVVYGLVYVSPIGPWSTWGFAAQLSGGVVALVYLLGAVALGFTAYSYARMCIEVPDAGSAYSYARFTMGEAAGFLTGWMILLDYLLLPALMYVFCGISMNSFVPSIPSWAWILVIAAYNIGVNWFGIETSARFNLATLILQFLMLAVVLVAALWVMGHSSAPMFTSAPWWNANANLRGVFSGASLCVMAYLGFDAITTLAAEVRPEQRHRVGQAVLFTIGLLGALAVLDVWLLSDLARGFTSPSGDPTTLTFDVLRARISPAFGGFMGIAAILATAISITPPMVTGVARVLYTMAEKGEMPHYLRQLHPAYRVPGNAILTSGAVSVAIALYFASQFDTLTAMVNFGALLAFAAVNMSVIVLFVFKRRSRNLAADLLLPLLGIASIGAVLTQMSGTGLLVGSCWLIAGVVVYLVVRVRSAGRAHAPT